MFDHLRADVAHLAEIRTRQGSFSLLQSLLFDNGFQAVVLHRLAHGLRASGVPVLGPLVARVALTLTGADISPAAEIGPGLMISHGTGLVIGGDVRVGRNALLLQQVTIGAASLSRIDRMPIIGDDAFIGAGACIIGSVTVGDRVFVGANAVVTVDVGDDSKVVCETGIRIDSRLPQSGPRAVGDP